MPAVTGDAWDLSNPKQPTAEFDPDAVRDIPMDWSAWLASIGSSYAGHEVVVPAGSPLQCVQSSQSGGVVRVRIARADGANPPVGSRWPITCHIVALNGEEEDQTVYLKIVSR